MKKLLLSALIMYGFASCGAQEEHTILTFDHGYGIEQLDEPKRVVIHDDHLIFYAGEFTYRYEKHDEGLYVYKDRDGDNIIELEEDRMICYLYGETDIPVLTFYFS